MSLPLAPSDSYVLLIEDNPGDARLTQMQLSDAGLPPLVWVQSLAAGLVQLGLQPSCAAVLLDLSLPDSTGLDALQALRAASAQLPVIVLTGDGSDLMGLDAVDHGAQDYLVKGSFEAPLLKRAIRFSAQRKRSQQALLEQSLHDELTGLPRRTLLMDRLQQALALGERNSVLGALMCLDLDGFKPINDAHGHAAGDAVLRATALRLQSSVRESDTVARLGGDEFAVLLPEVAGIERAVALGNKLLTAVGQPLHWQGRMLRVTASIGVARLRGLRVSADVLLEQADAAMYQAKREGKCRVCAPDPEAELAPKQPPQVQP